MSVSGAETAVVRTPPWVAGATEDPRPQAWRSHYQLWTIAVDVLAGALAGVIALLVRFGFDTTAPPRTYSRVSLLLPLLWVGSLWLARAHEARFLGQGVEEWRRVAHAGVALSAAVGFAAFAVRYDLARGYVVLALPMAVATSLTGRYLLRRRLHRQRALGRCLQRVVAVGHLAQVQDLVRQTRSEPGHGMSVVGICVPGRDQRSLMSPGQALTVGDLRSVPAVVCTSQADTVVVMACPELSGTALRQLAWDLEGLGTDLVVGPGLIEVAAPRLHVRPVSGLPLLHVEHPALSGGRLLLKGGLDRVGAALLLIALSPLLLAISLAVRLTSPGPAFFRQTRVGRDGEEFTLLKFRSMVVDADRRRDELVGLNEKDGPLFKIRRDPRVTPVGSWLRRYSLDELPQLVNVLRGDMSLVGPRPPLPSEVATYVDMVRRRLRVKPGLTGLWQISGRSDLSWEESVRLDLRYVENWSLALDVLILCRTVSVVLAGRGAY